MKKMMTTLLSLMLAFALPLAAIAEEAEPAHVLEGLVTEILEGGFLMEDATHGEVMVNTGEETVLDGVLLEEELAVGMYVQVDYNGVMTRSLPPQVYADRIACCRLQGVVSEIYEDGSFLLTGDAVYEEIVIHMTQPINLYADMPVTVYYSGAVTMSLPAQASALWMVLPVQTGVVSELTEEGFLLTDADGVNYEVKLTEDTVLSLMPAAEEEAETVIDIEEGAEEAEIVMDDETEEAEEEGEVIVELFEGASVQVIYNGMLTRSIPAQLTALEVVVEQ